MSDHDDDDEPIETEDTVHLSLSYDVTALARALYEQSHATRGNGLPPVDYIDMNQEQRYFWLTQAQDLARRYVQHVLTEDTKPAVVTEGQN